MKTVSVCNGISCFRESANEVKMPISINYTSEINPDAIMVADANHPEDIPYKLGDITKWREWDIDWSLVDLLVGGTPCQGLSRAHNGRENLKDFRSILFYTYVDIKNNLMKCNPNAHFLLENVKPDKVTLAIMNEEIGIEPMEINSNLVSAQNRKRMYWFNWEAEQPKDLGIVINDIIYDNSYKVFTDARIENTKVKTKNYLKWDKSGKGYWSQQDRAYYLTGKMCTVPKAHPCDKLNIMLGEGKYRRCHRIEAARLQTMPDGYCDCIKSDNKAIGLYGDGWTKSVIMHLLNALHESLRIIYAN